MKKKTDRNYRKSTIKMIILSVLAILVVLVIVSAILGARRIHLRSETVVNLSQEQAWSFFQDPHNLAKWDRSVARVEPTAPDPNNINVGYTFDTIAPPKSGQKEGLRMSYKVTALVPNQYAKISLLNSPMFKEAVWTLALEPAHGGTKVISEVDFVPKPQYSFVVPILLLTSKNALGTDMDYLKAQMESYAENRAIEAPLPKQ
ncbi:MAG TPA: SRPBCC family protein [Candidatus Saccharimonadales bacterium]|nr:SRPBCC family protein [Candidatus Saccharimonadales bacterium]